MELLIAFLLLGVFLGWKRLLPAKVLDQSGKIITASIIFLLTTMGLKIGLDRQILSKLGEYGLQAFLFAVLTILFSLILVWILEKIFVKKSSLPQENEFAVEADLELHPYRMTGIILGAFFIGIFLGFAVVPAGMIAGKFLGWSMAEGAAVGAGFGWYSLSGVIISEIHSVALGTIAFLSNVIREVSAIIIIPLLARRNSSYNCCRRPAWNCHHSFHQRCCFIYPCSYSCTASFRIEYAAA